MVKKQVSDTNPGIIFLSIYLLFNFSFNLQLLSRALCQTGRDGIVHFEGILGKIQGRLKNGSGWKRKDLKLSLSVCSVKNQVFRCENGSNKLLTAALLISHPDQGSELH